MNIAIIYNPKSGKQLERSSTVEHFARLLLQNGYRVLVRPTSYSGHASILAQEAVSESVDLIVAHGGDGTLNEVLQGVVGSKVALAVWPGGTANVVAQDLKLPRTPETILKLIKLNHTVRVHVGRAGSRYFFFSAGIGLDAEVINNVDAQLKKQIGKGAFWLAGMAHLLKWHPTPIEIQAQGRRYNGTFVAIGKSFGYGGTLSLTPHASMVDPNLDVCIFTGQSKLQYLNYLVACFNGQQLQMDGVYYFKTKSLTATASTPLPVQVDGEVVGQLPMQFELVPDAVSLLVPVNTFPS